MDDLNYLNSLNPDELYDYLRNKRSIEGYNTISASSLKTFLECRLKYFFQYIKDWRIIVKSPNFSIGTAFHAACELDNRNQALGVKTKKSDLFNEFELVWNSEMQGMDDYNQFVKDNAHTIGLDLVERYFNSGIRKAIKTELAAPYVSDNSLLKFPAAELHIDIPLYSYKLETVMSDDFRVTGFIDLVGTADQNTKNFNKGDLLIVDYKTAAKMWSQQSVNTNLQILLYAYAMRYLLKYTHMFEHLGKTKEDYIGIICLEKGKKLKKSFKPSRIVSQFIKVNEDEFEYLEKLLLKVSSDVTKYSERMDEWPAQPEDNKCKYCPYLEPCLAYRKGAPFSDLEKWYDEQGKE